jgi:uncharacterized protein YbjT (DUF2867 family)
MVVILVVGATGRVGRQLVQQLDKHGVAVRAVTRNRPAGGLSSAVEEARADLADASSLEPHLKGVEAVFLLWPFTSLAAAVELGPPVVQMIVQRVPRIVYLSAQAAAEQPGSLWARMECLIDASGARWTFLRPVGFAANTLIWAEQIRVGDVVRWPYGAAARSLIDERDIAAVAMRALTEPGHESARYVLTGPERLTQVEQLQVIATVLGRRLRWEELSRPDAREPLVRIFGDAAFAEAALDAWAALVTRPEPVTSTVKDITGVPARTFHRWVSDNAAAFR